MNNILVVNVNWLGDAVFATPVFAALKQAYPQARLSCLCVPRLQEVLRHCPDVDGIIIYDEKGKDRWPWKKLALIWRLRRARFDAAFLLHRSMTRAWFVFLAGIPVRVGYSKVPGFLTHPVAQVSQGGHRMDEYLQVLETFGIPCPDRRYSLNVEATRKQSLATKLQERGIAANDEIVVFNIGGNWDLKRWPLDFWARLAQCVHERSALKIIFSGSARDKNDVLRIMESPTVRAVNMAGETSLGELLALFARAKTVVSADSGPLHLASSVGAKVIGLYGPTRPEVTGPRGTSPAIILFKDIGCNKAPCYHLSCPLNRCMHAIGVEDVWQAVQKFIG